MLKRKEKPKDFDLSVVYLPEDELKQLDIHYPPNKKVRPVLLVCIYNTKQLAIEIAHYLKDGTNNCSTGCNHDK